MHEYKLVYLLLWLQNVIWFAETCRNKTVANPDLFMNTKMSVLAIKYAVNSSALRFLGSKYHTWAWWRSGSIFVRKLGKILSISRSNDKVSPMSRRTFESKLKWTPPTCKPSSYVSPNVAGKPHMHITGWLHCKNDLQQLVTRGKRFLIAKILSQIRGILILNKLFSKHLVKLYNVHSPQPHWCPAEDAIWNEVRKYLQREPGRRSIHKRRQWESSEERCKVISRSAQNIISIQM